MINDFSFRFMQISDLDEVCQIHKETFDEAHFLASMPKHLLKKYFELLLKNNDYCVVAVDNSTAKIAGYIFGGYKTVFALNKFIKLYFPLVLSQLIRHPKFFWEKFIFLSMKITGKVKYPSIKLRIILIAVSSLYKGTGLSKRLLDYFEENLIIKKELKYGLSVRKENKKAIDFYLKNGFIKEFEFMKSFCFYKIIQK